MLVHRLMGGTAAWVIALGVAVPAYAQVVSSSIRGEVVSTADGSTVKGAKVEIVDTRTNAKSTQSTTDSGAFDASGLEVGGPYKIIVTAPGFRTREIGGVIVQLGSPYKVVVDLQSEAAQEKVTVVGQRNQKIDNRGIAQSFGARNIEEQPRLLNDPKEILQQSSLVVLDGLDGPRGNRRMRIAGSNPRCNSFQIDGLPQNDGFGLKNDGYPTQRPPMPLEWMKQVQLAVTPYDTEYNDFCGGVVNAVTKSGENDWHGGIYYSENRSEWTGRGFGGTKPTKGKFNEQDYGMFVGGAIIPDKLFFFGGYDRLLNQRPSAAGFGTNGSGTANDIPGVTNADVTAVVNAAKNQWGYDAGTVGAAGTTQDNKRYFGKLTWQINDDHRAQVSYNHAEGGDFNAGIVFGGVNGRTGTGGANSSTSILPLSSTIVNNNNVLEAYSGSINSNWTDRFSTEVRFGRVRIDSEPRTIGAPFPQMVVRVDGPTASAADDGYIMFGQDRSRHNNILHTGFDIYKATGTYELNDHIFKGGLERKEYKFFNAFLQNANGVYRFDSIADFIAGKVGAGTDPKLTANDGGNPITFQGAVTGNIADTNAIWGYNIDSIYLQDDYSITDDLAVMVGLRFDSITSTGAIRENTFFKTAYGITNTTTLDGLSIVLPRMSFTYAIDESEDFGVNFNLRGGVGLFSGGSPNVWVSNNYSNNGTTNVQISGTPGVPGPGTIAGVSTTPFGAGPTFNGLPVPATIQAALAAQPVGRSGPVNALDPSFQTPAQWRGNLGLDVKFEGSQIGGMLGDVLDGFNVSLDWLKFKGVDQIYYVDLKLQKSAVNGGKTPDGRILYDDYVTVSGLACAGPSACRLNDSNRDLVVRNADKGHSEFVVLGLNNKWDYLEGTGSVALNLSYTYAKVYDLGGLGSSTANSQYNFRTFINTNEAEVGRSDHERRHSAAGGLTFTQQLFGVLQSRLKFFGVRASGVPYSMTFDGNPYRFGGTTYMDNPPTGNGLQVYVPKVDGSGNVVTTGVDADPIISFNTAAAAPTGYRNFSAANLADFNNMLRGTGLGQYAGQIAPRNEFFSTYTSRFDVGFEQEIDLFFEDKATIELNIFNLGNLLNRKWGLYEDGGGQSPNNKPVISATCTDATCSKYQYNGWRDPVGINTDGAGQSIWQMSVGVRYEF